jgi:ABC-2 type transport system permease protein
MSSISRIFALVLRNYYLLRGSWPRMAEIFFWPSMEVLVWGFMSFYMAGASGPYARAGQLMLGGALLWLVLNRGQAAIIISFMEEMWSRNLGHLFVAPLRPWEFVTSIILIAALRSSLGVGVAMLLAVTLFHSEIFTLGPALVLFFALLLMMSWWIGMFIMGVIFRHGMGAEWLVWMLVFLFLPFCCVFYPLAALPGWAQALALIMPASHVFEGMRGVMAGAGLSWHHLGWALGLNLLYLALASWYLHRSLNHARAQAMLVQQGE